VTDRQTDGRTELRWLRRTESRSAFACNKSESFRALELRTTSIMRLSTRLYGRQCPRSSFHCQETDSPRQCMAFLRAQPSTANIPSVGSLGNSSLQQQHSTTEQMHMYQQPSALNTLLFLNCGFCSTNLLFLSYSMLGKVPKS